MITRECTITVAVGLHARPANEFAAVAKSAPCDITVSTGGNPPVKANSPLRLLTLKAHQGDTLTIYFDTNDEILVDDLFTKFLAAISE